MAHSAETLVEAPDLATVVLEPSATLTTALRPMVQQSRALRMKTRVLMQCSTARLAVGAAAAAAEAAQLAAGLGVVDMAGVSRECATLTV